MYTPLWRLGFLLTVPWYAVININHSTNRFQVTFSLHLGLHGTQKTVILQGRGVKNQHFHSSY